MSSSSAGVSVHVVVVVVVVVIVVVVVVFLVVDVLVGEVERNCGALLALEEVLDDGLGPPAELVPATGHRRAAGAHPPMSVHEAHDPDEREQCHDHAVDELKIAKIWLELCTATHTVIRPYSVQIGQLSFLKLIIKHAQAFYMTL